MCLTEENMAALDHINMECSNYRWRNCLRYYTTFTLGDNLCTNGQTIADFGELLPLSGDVGVCI